MNREIDDSAGVANEWSRGWRTLVAGFFAMGVGWNFTNVVASIFMKPMQAEFGWTRTELSFAPVASLIMAMLLPVAGFLLDRFGPRRVAIGGLVTMAGAFLFMAGVQPNHVHYYLGVLFLGLAGTVSNSVILARGVAPWFQRRLGLAIGLMMTGASVSAAVVVPLLSLVVAGLGWRAGFLALAGLTIIVGLLPVLIWFREPSDRRKDGGQAMAPERHAMRTIVSTLAFWQVAMACGIAALPIGGFIGHLIPLLTDKGFALEVAASFGSVFAIAIGFGRIANGYLLDRLHPPFVTAATLFLAAAGAVTLYIFGGGVISWVLIAIAIALIGLAQGAEGDYIKFFSMRLFGLGNFSRVVAILAMIISIGMAAGGLTFAKVFDIYGTYEPAIVGSAILYIVGAVIFATINMRPPLENRPTLQHSPMATR